MVSDPNFVLNGIVSDAHAHITVGGRSASLTAASDGANFSLNGFQLQEGLNTFTIKVRGANNLLVSRTISVTYAVPPALTIQSHKDGEQTASATTTVQGTVSDPGATVTVNGQTATVKPNGVFEIANVPLAIGANTIDVVATGANRGVARKTITVHSQPIYLHMPKGRNYVTYDMFLSDSQYAEGQMWNLQGAQATDDFVDLLVQSAQRMAPNTWRFNIQVDPIGLSTGEYDFTLTFVILNTDLTHTVRSEKVRFRAEYYGQVLAVFDPNLEGLVTQSATLQVSGRAIGSPAAVAVNGITATLGGTSGHYNVRPFTVAVPSSMDATPSRSWQRPSTARSIGTSSWSRAMMERTSICTSPRPDRRMRAPAHWSR